MSHHYRLYPLIVDKNIRPSRKYICKKCGEVFYTKKSGVPKYCMDCRVIVYYANH